MSMSMSVSSVHKSHLPQLAPATSLQLFHDSMIFFFLPSAGQTPCKEGLTLFSLAQG